MAVRVAGLDGVGPPGHAPVVLPDSRRRRSPGAWSTPSSDTTWITCPARSWSTPAGSSWRPALTALLAGTSGRWPWSTRPSAPFPTCRAWTRAPSRRFGRAASRWCRRATWCSSSRPCGRRPSWRRTAPRPRRSTASRIAPSTPPARRFATGRALDEFDLQQQMWTWFDEEGLDSDSPPVVAVGPHASSPHYLPTRASSAAPSPRCAAAPGPVGQAAGAGQRVRRHHLGGLHRAARSRTRMRAGVRRRGRRAGRGGEPGPGTGARRPGRARLGGRPRRPPGARGCRIRRLRRPPDRP